MQSNCSLCCSELESPVWTWGCSCGGVHLRCLHGWRNMAVTQCTHTGFAPPCPTCRKPWEDAWTDQLVCRLDVFGLGFKLVAPEVTSADARCSFVPSPPRSIIPLCCHGVELTGNGFVETSSREMKWFPIKKGTTWEGAYVCLRCDFVAYLTMPQFDVLCHGQGIGNPVIRGRTWSRPICGIHGPKALEICHATGSRSWVCASDELPDEVPVKINACRSYDVFLLSKPNPVVEAVVEVVDSTDDEGESENPATPTACDLSCSE